MKFGITEPRGPSVTWFAVATARLTLTMWSIAWVFHGRIAAVARTVGGPTTRP